MLSEGVVERPGTKRGGLKGYFQKQLGLSEADTAAIKLSRITSLFSSLARPSYANDLTVGLAGFSSRLSSDRLLRQTQEGGKRQPLLSRHERPLEDLQDDFVVHGITLAESSVAMLRTDLAVASSVDRTNVCGETLQSDVFGGQKVSKKVTAAAHTSAANVTRTSRVM